MKLAGIAGVVAMLLFLLPSSVGADETPLEHQVRTYLQSSARYKQVAGVSDEAALGRVFCGTAGLGDRLMCAIAVSDRGISRNEVFHRYFVSRSPHGGFSFYECPNYIHSADMAYRPEDDPCADELDRG